MKDIKYEVLLKILDNIRKEAPDSPELHFFHSRQTPDIQSSRAQAFIHLFLLVKFGLHTFNERQSIICDGSQDGGLDAYYISEKESILYLIQSKFKMSGSSFANESLSAVDLIRMELDRILTGNNLDSNGLPYNSKITQFQSRYHEAQRNQIYQQKVIFLANVNNYNDSQMRKLTSELDYEVYDFAKTYLELVKPICSDTYYDPDKITIELDISEKNTPQLSQTILTTYGNCDATAVFVPTSEIGRVMSTYKNAILRYNPRNYLGLSKNAVNREIRKSILNLTYNDFALLNNGITILADEQEFSRMTGKKNVGRLILTNPQIINGGQTAYTLSEIFEYDNVITPGLFDGKEVLVKIIVLKQQITDSPENKYKFIDAISTSTNRQTTVTEADRHSLNPVLCKVQDLIFLKYGYLLELKRGEFYESLQKRILNKKSVINRTLLLRSYVAFTGDPTPARGNSEQDIYEDNFFDNIFSKLFPSDPIRLASEMFYAYKVHSYLISKEKEVGKESLNKFGYSFRYGKYAVVYAAALSMHEEFRNNLQYRSPDELEKYINQNVLTILDKWRLFEETIQKKDVNKSYFNTVNQLADFDTYYKGPTLNEDIKQFFT